MINVLITYLAFRETASRTRLNLPTTYKLPCRSRINERYQSWPLGYGEFAHANNFLAAVP
jgi:hypothetical protein